MFLRAGIPTLDELAALRGTAFFQRHVEFNRRFLHAHSQAMRAYGMRWGADPLKLWSRQWEYPFAAGRLTAFASETGGRELTILDAGSGVTYFDYFLCSEMPGARVICCDSDASYARMFDAINAVSGAGSVCFRRAVLQSLPLDDRSVDAICCISVLEHTDRHEAILGEFQRVLRPGGALVLTFDISLDGRFELKRSAAEALLRSIVRRFVIRDDADIAAELARLDDPAPLLSTDNIRRTEPQLLPWRHPWLLALRDVLCGRGFTGGFRSKTVYCLEARAPQDAPARGGR